MVVVSDLPHSPRRIVDKVEQQVALAIGGHQMNGIERLANTLVSTKGVWTYSNQ